MAQKNKNQNKLVVTLSSRKAVMWFWIVVATPFVGLGLLLALISVGAFGKLPSFEELENPKTNLMTEIYSYDGKLIGSFFVENRSDVTYGELNDSLVAGLVATEDMRFYTHSGIDFIALARVLFKTVLGADRGQGGGSTITQQLAKNLYRIRENAGEDIGRGNILIFKLKEWITAVRLEYNYTKEEIIAMYLNTVTYSRNTFGIKTAAQTFFNKMPADLTINESALLVGMVNAPGAYDPIRNPEKAQWRRNKVLERMASCDFITREQRDSLSALPMEVEYRQLSHNTGSGSYFREMIRKVMTMKRPERTKFNNAEDKWNYEQEIKRWDSNPLYGWCHKNKKPDGSNYNLYTDGLRIYTTLDATMQQYAEEAVLQQLKSTIQPQYDAQFKASRVQFIDQSKEQVERIVFNAMRYSDRYMALQKANVPDAEIRKIFDTPTEMSIFSYKGDVDTLMTPRDSILYHKRIMRSSFMALDPSNGYVRAYVGGPDFRYFQYDMVSQGRRQVGSTIKPFIYTFAIDHRGYTPCTMVPNLPVTIETPTGEPWQPKEAGGRVDIYTGELHPLQWGLANSRNNYSAWIMKQVQNPQAVADYIHRLGIKSYIDPVYALALGVASVSLYEMVASYATYVNRGVYNEPLFVTRIADRYGNVISSFAPVSTDAIRPETAYTMVGMLRSVVTAGTAGRLRYSYGFTDVQMGGKTGTSQNNWDTWFMGITPKLVAGVWVGGEDPSVHLTGRAEGSTVALPVYGEFMKRVYANPSLGVRRTDTFPIPVGAATYNCSEEEVADNGVRSVDEDFFE